MEEVNLASSPEKTPRRSARPYIPTLDGWRAVAIVLVMLAHVVGRFGREGERGIVGLVTHGAFGVDIFFALSGFLICSLLLDEKDQAGRISLGRFYTRRAFRILPAAFLVLATLLVLRETPAFSVVTGRELLAVTLFVRNYVPGSVCTQHFWSLSVEEHFYLLTPFVLAFASRRWALAIFAGLAIAAATHRFHAFAPGYVPPFNPTAKAEWRTENRVDALLYGAVIAVLLRWAHIRKLAERFMTTGTLALLLVVFVGLMVGFHGSAARRTIAAVCLPLVITHTVVRPTAIPGRLLEMRWLRWIGKISYSLYLWQQLLLVPAGDHPAWMQGVPQCVLFTFAIAALSHYVIEKPMVRLGHRFAAAPVARLRDPMATAETSVVDAGIGQRFGKA